MAIGFLMTSQGKVANAKYKGTYVIFNLYHLPLYRECRLFRNEKMNIELTREQYKKIINGESITLVAPPPETSKAEIELRSGNWSFMLDGTVNELFVVPNPTNYIKAGVERQTSEQAQIAAKGMLRRNRLSALAERLGTGEKEFVAGKSQFCIKLTHTNSWSVIRVSYDNYPEAVYMDKATANAVCNVLNVGLFSLELDDEKQYQSKNR